MITNNPKHGGRRKLCLISLTSKRGGNRAVFIALPCDMMGKVKINSDDLRDMLDVKPGECIRFG